MAGLLREEQTGHVAAHKPKTPRRREITNNGLYNPATGRGKQARARNEGHPINEEYVDQYTDDE